jgi:hypothetical protein
MFTQPKLDYLDYQYVSPALTWNVPEVKDELCALFVSPAFFWRLPTTSLDKEALEPAVRAKQFGPPPVTIDRAMQASVVFISRENALALKPSLRSLVAAPAARRPCSGVRKRLKKRSLAAGKCIAATVLQKVVKGWLARCAWHKLNLHYADSIPCDLTGRVLDVALYERVKHVVGIARLALKIVNAGDLYREMLPNRPTWSDCSLRANKNEKGKKR